MKDLLYLREKSLKEIIELIFQVYIDSYSDPHEVLKKNSFGRAHHRLLCIIEGNPNISIADILRKLKIGATKTKPGTMRERIVKFRKKFEPTKRYRDNEYAAIVEIIKVITTTVEAT